MSAVTKCAKMDFYDEHTRKKSALRSEESKGHTAKEEATVTGMHQGMESNWVVYGEQPCSRGSWTQTVQFKTA